MNRQAAYGLAFVLLAAPSWAAAETLFKCKGSDQQVHYQDKACEEENEISHKTIDSVEAGSSSGTAIAYPDAGGTYRVNGSINGYPLNMQVDTGAFSVVVREDIAQKIGLSCGASASAATGNGTATGCKTQATTLQIGGITLKYVDMLILPNIPVEAILGQSALKRLKVEQSNGQIRMSVAEGATK
jgi:clan AA aspartic protease (TIGR02281 family)